MRRVLIGTPSHDGRIDVHYAHSLMQTARLCWQQEIDLHEIYLAYDAIIQNARNDLVALAIEHKFDDLIFIDSDQEWEPSWPIRLLARPPPSHGGQTGSKPVWATTTNGPIG